MERISEPPEPPECRRGSPSALTVGLMEHQNCESQTLFPFCFRMFRSSEDQMDGPYHVTGKRLAETPDWRIKEATRKEKHLKNNRGKGVIVQSEVEAPDPPLPSPPLPKRSKPLELPDKYKTLNNLFAGMECSIRWLALQNQLPTFRNICTQMERQTKKVVKFQKPCCQIHLIEVVILGHTMYC